MREGWSRIRVRLDWISDWILRWTVVCDAHHERWGLTGFLPDAFSDL